jgi:hypothetical protein
MLTHYLGVCRTVTINIIQPMLSWSVLGVLYHWNGLEDPIVPIFGVTVFWVEHWFNLFVCLV